MYPFLFSTQNNWVPRRPLSSLKTINQREAQQEHEQEQEWLKHGYAHLAKPKHREGGRERGREGEGRKGGFMRGVGMVTIRAI